MKKFIIDDEKLITEWNFDKNNEIGLHPEKITCGVDTKAWWTCKQCGLVYYSSIGHRSRGKGCPNCANKNRCQNKINTLIKKNGSFEKLHPELMAEWDYENNNISPDCITEKSNKKVKWICKKCQNSWITSPNERIRGRGCPNCSKQLIGENSKKSKLKKSGSLLEACPVLAEEWDINKNSISCDKISPKSHYNAFWVCHKCGHKWKAPVYSRYIGAGCSKCSKVKKFSFPEKLILHFIKKVFPDVIENYKPAFLKPKEIDIFIPSYTIGIEYDGERFHQDIEKDKIKSNICFENNLTLIRIREPKCPDIDFSIVYKMKNLKDYKGAINFIYKTLNVFKEINDEDILNASIIVSSDILNIKKENSLANLYPEIAKEWDYDLNGNLLPEYISYGSNMHINWICENGHKFKMTVSKRTLNGSKCPICNKIKLKNCKL